MDLLRSSILGREFVNYRKTTLKEERMKFSDKVRKEGIGNVPIVVDSVDKDISEALYKPKVRRSIGYGRELVFHMEETLNSVLKEVKILLVQEDKEYLVSNITIGLEDGTMPSLDTDLGTIYKRHRNIEDKILYLMITKEQTIYGYILSIIKFLYNKLTTPEKKLNFF